MKIVIKESELRTRINKVLNEAIEEGPWMDSAKNLGKAGLGFAKETGKKIGQGIDWLGDKLEQGAEKAGNKIYDFMGGDLGEVEECFLYTLERKNINYPQMVTNYEEKLQALVNKYPNIWLFACKKVNVDPESLPVKIQR